MAKGLGLIGNFRGKFGNAVGYNLKDSNNKQTQGIRIYQPIVKNPKTSAQAEQRAKLAPINVTYRALKDIIDRGQEGVAYGNKSRLAWLSQALKGYEDGWFQKGADIKACAIVPITKGSLTLTLEVSASELGVTFNWGTDVETAPTKIGELSTILLQYQPGLQEGDQITCINVRGVYQSPSADVISFVIDKTSEITLASIGLTAHTSDFAMQQVGTPVAAAVVVSRLGLSGQHLRSTSSLVMASEFPRDNKGDVAKQNAIRSYMASGVSSDWPEDPIED